MHRDQQDPEKGRIRIRAWLALPFSARECVPIAEVVGQALLLVLVVIVVMLSESRAAMAVIARPAGDEAIRPGWAPSPRDCFASLAIIAFAGVVGFIACGTPTPVGE